VIRNGKIVNVTFPGEQPPLKIYKENELDWFKLYQPEGEEK
jgi:hypothetical protein